MLTCDVVSLYEVKGFLGEIVRKQTSVEILFHKNIRLLGKELLGTSLLENEG